MIWADRFRLAWIPLAAAVVVVVVVLTAPKCASAALFCAAAGAMLATLDAAGDVSVSPVGMA